MAERRMFAKSIVLSDAFLDMPLSARCLYFTLGMLADDDGFVGNPKSIIRQCGASQDDMNVLLSKRYLLKFDSGVMVIKHWRMNNYLRGDRHQSTTYIEEMDSLMIDGKGAYTEKNNHCISETANLLPKDKKPLTAAQQKRLDAKKESSLPSTFDNRIRNAFVGHPCPICGVIMGYDNNLIKPTIQHNTPISCGGKHEIDNISVICQSCYTSIQNKVETPPYNTDEVRRIWECIGNVSGMATEVSIGKDRLDKDSIGKDSIYNNPLISPLGKEEDRNFDCHTNTVNYQYIKDTVKEEYVNYIVNHTELDECVTLWMKHKDERKPKSSNHYGETGMIQLLTKIYRQCIEHGISAIITTIEESISNNYQGITWNKVGEIKKNNPQSLADQWLNA